MKKKQIITTCCVAAAILVGVFVWQAYFSATKIAFVNFQTINLKYFEGERQFICQTKGGLYRSIWTN